MLPTNTLMRRVVLTAGAVIVAAAVTSNLSADDTGAALTPAEQAFVKTLANRNMIGTFTVEGRDDRTPKEERYEIANVTKIGENLWTIEARIKYGKVDATVPVPVTVLWAGDTPMISVTDLTIPLVGSEFSARVLFHDNLYAGTWKHGKAGGHMWGRLEDRPAGAAGSGAAQ